jgi:hypothetical protein
MTAVMRNSGPAESTHSPRREIKHRNRARCNDAGCSRRGASSQHRRRASWPVGRVLCTRLRGPAAIHLGLPLLTASCGLPASIGRATLKRSLRPSARRHQAFSNLAPGGVYQATAVTCSAGGLLHPRPQAPDQRFHHQSQPFSAHCPCSDDTARLPQPHGRPSQIEHTYVAYQKPDGRGSNI